MKKKWKRPIIEVLEIKMTEKFPEGEGGGDGGGCGDGGDGGLGYS